MNQTDSEPRPEREAPIFAWQVLEDGQWGTIAAVIMPGMSAVPLVVRSRPLAEGAMRRFAELHVLSTGKRVRLARFDFAREMDVIEP